VSVVARLSCSRRSYVAHGVEKQDLAAGKGLKKQRRNGGDKKLQFSWHVLTVIAASFHFPKLSTIPRKMASPAVWMSYPWIRDIAQLKFRPREFPKETLLQRGTKRE
jgi:hypothetical protein